MKDESGNKDEKGEKRGNNKAYSAKTILYFRPGQRYAESIKGINPGENIREQEGAKGLGQRLITEQKERRQKGENHDQTTYSLYGDRGSQQRY